MRPVKTTSLPDTGVVTRAQTGRERRSHHVPQQRTPISSRVTAQDAPAWVTQEGRFWASLFAATSSKWRSFAKRWKSASGSGDSSP